MYNLKILKMIVMMIVCWVVKEGVLLGVEKVG